MTQTAIKEKILNLQTELEIIKQAVIKEPNFNIDEKNWRAIKQDVKKTRRGLYESRYGKR